MSENEGEKASGVFRFNPFSTNVLLLYPLETSENRGFSDVFRGYKSATLVKKVKILSLKNIKEHKDLTFVFLEALTFF